jgi:argininosuccinate lyase
MTTDPHREGAQGRGTAPQGSGAAAQALEIGARLAHGPSDLLIDTAFRQELAGQAHLFAAMGSVDLAHTLVMMEGGICPLPAGRELLSLLQRLDRRPADFTLDPARGDLYTNREAWLCEQSAAGLWLGAGRARREATTTAFLIHLRVGILALAEALSSTVGAIVARAALHRAALLPDYTYLQAAQPTTFGHYLLGFAYPLLRDLERCRALYGRLNRSPAGCGSTNGSRLPQGRHRLMTLLGFEGLTAHARDAMWQADLPIECASVLTTILIQLDRLGEDLQIFATEEFALVELDDRHARASKIMPQKKNPFALTHVRGVASAMIGTLAASAALGRTPSGQPDNRLPLYGMVPQALADTLGAVALMGEVVAHLTFHAPRGRQRLADGSALATDLAEVLVLECGLDFRQAHRLVGHLVRQHLAERGGILGLTPEGLATAAAAVLGRRIEIAPERLRAALDPEAAIQARTEPGGAAPAPMAAMLDDCAEALAEASAWIAARRRHLQTAEGQLVAAVAAAVGG